MKSRISYGIGVWVNFTNEANMPATFEEKQKQIITQISTSELE